MPTFSTIPAKAEITCIAFCHHCLREAYAILAASLLARQGQTHPQTPSVIYSDHLNSIKMLSTDPLPHVIKSHPARSLYRWIASVWQSMCSIPRLLHVKAHTSSSSIPARLNRHADLIASTSHPHQIPMSLPSVPPATFFMDNYVLYSFSLGFVESDIPSFIAQHLAKLQPINFNGCHEPLPNLSLFDNTTPSVYPYAKASSAFSAVVQLYSRSGQLDTALNLSSRLQKEIQPWCRFGCPVLEDAYHIFILCPHFASLRHSATQDLRSEIKAILQSLPGSVDQEAIINTLSSIFTNNQVWPSFRSFYYLGLLPKFDDSRLWPSLHIRVNQVLHSAAVRLAGRIWGIVRRETRANSFSLSSLPDNSPIPIDNTTMSTIKQPTTSILHLPSHLSSILSPCTSYKYFSISFQ